MKARVKLLILCVLCFPISTVLAQDSDIIVSMKFTKGKNEYLGMSSVPSEQKNKTGFELPINSEFCKIGYYTLSPFHQSYYERNRSDSLAKRFEMLYSVMEIDTMQLIANKLITNRIYFCTWIEGNIKKIVVDSECDSSFLNNEIISYNLHDGLYSLFDTNIYFEYSDVVIKYDSMNNKRIKTIPIQIAVNAIEIDPISNQKDSLQVHISLNGYLSGQALIEKDTAWFYMNAMNFDQYYPKRPMVVLKYKYFNHDVYKYCDNNEIPIWNTIYSIEYFDYRTKKLHLKFKNQLQTGIMPGNYFTISPEMEQFENYTLVFFTASWCGACKYVLDSLKEFHETVPEVDIININTEQDSMRFNNYIKWNSIDWKVIFDKKSKGHKSYYWDTYGVSNIPVLVLLNPQRKVLLYGLGAGSCESIIKKIISHGPEHFDNEQ